MKSISIIIKGNSRGRVSLIHKLKRILSSYKLSFYETTHQNHAIELAKNIVDNNTDILLIAGGDGSLNEVVNGCMQGDKMNLEKLSILVLPYGTGNDFAKNLNITKNIKKLKNIIQSNNTVKVDVGNIEFVDNEDKILNRHFINITDIGIGGVAAKKLTTASGLFGAAIKYHSSIIKAFFLYKPIDIDLQGDNFSYKGKILSLCMANGRYFASGMCIAPNANISDGKIELVIMKNISILDYIKNLSKVKNGKLLDHSEVEYAKISSCTIDADKGTCPIDMDGEFIGYAPLKLSLEKSAINFLINH